MISKFTSRLKKSHFSLIGMGLCCANFVTIFRWFSNQYWQIFNRPFQTCYPFFPECINSLDLNEVHAKIILFLYFVLNFVSFVFYIKVFLDKRSLQSWVSRFAYLCLFGATLLKFFVFISRYDLMGNYHIMHFSMSLIYFVFPTSMLFYSLMLALQYFMAGLLKLNIEWQSGAALVRQPWLVESLSLASLGYAVCLELFLIWGLFFKAHWFRVLTYLQLILFHLFSWFFVGYFYPMIMFSLLLPLGFIISTENTDQNFIKKLKHHFAENRWASTMASALLVLLLYFNLAKYLYSIDASLDGHHRFFRLSMLDARSECKVIFSITEGSHTRIIEIPKFHTAIRVQCDPVVYESYLHQMCQSLEPNQRLSYFHWSKRSTDRNFRFIRKYHNYCQEVL